MSSEGSCIFCVCGNYLRLLVRQEPVIESLEQELVIESLEYIESLECVESLEYVS